MTAVCVAKARDLMVNWNIAYVILIVGHSSPAARDFHVTFGGRRRRYQRFPRIWMPLLKNQTKSVS